MSDLIERQAAIDAVNEFFKLYAINRTMSNVTSLQDILRQLPSAQPCYKTDHGYMWLCPECGLEVHSDYDRCVRCGWERRTDE